MKKNKLIKPVIVTFVVLIFAALGYFIFFVVDLFAGSVTPLDPQVVEIKDDSKELSIFVGGDTMLGDAATKTLEAKGYAYPFAKLKGMIQSADFVAANLEAPISEKSPIQPMPKTYKYKMPYSVAPVFKNIGFDLFFLANNHITDYSHGGLLETIQSLDDYGILSMGAGENIQSARRGIIVKKGNTSVGILNYMAYELGYDIFYRHFAKSNRPGVAKLSEQFVVEDINKLRAGGAKNILISVHWGENYEPINDEQRNSAKMLVNAGASVVVGHHPHDYQPAEMIGNTPVFFSVGNLAFGTRGRKEFKYGFPVILYFNETGLYKSELYPVLTYNKLVKFKPQLLKKKYAETALREFFLNSSLPNMTVENSKGIVIFQ